MGPGGLFERNALFDIGARHSGEPMKVSVPTES